MTALRKGTSSLFDSNPKLCKEWDYDKNAPLSPETIGKSSNKLVWWKCSKGHEWKASVGNRTNKNFSSNCPYCSNRKILPGYNDLATINPELANEWSSKNKVLPTTVSVGSQKKYWWVCSCVHEWQATPYHRNKFGSQCPICVNQQVLKGTNDLASQNSSLAAEWNYEKNAGLTNGRGEDISTPDKIAVGSQHNVWWKCLVCGNEWQAAVSRRNEGSGCPYCTGQIAISGITDLLTTNPQLAKEWDYEKNKGLKNGLGLDISTPDRVKELSSQAVWWKCEKGHSWKAKISDRSKGGCPYCSGSRVWEGFNDLATVNPELAKEWDYEKNKELKPNMVTLYSGTKVWWKCMYGHSWQSTVANRSYGNGCPVCSHSGSSLPEQTIAYYLKQVCVVQQRQKINGKEVDIYLPQYKIGIEYDGWYYHKDKAERDDCKTRKLISEGICVVHIAENMRKTQYCGEIQVTNTNSIRIVYKVDDMGSNYENALRVLCNWLAERTGNAGFVHVDINVQRDLLEVRKQIDLNRKANSIAAKCPELVEEWDYEKNYPLTPEMVSYGNRIKVYWKGKCGHSWKASVDSRNRGRGCPICSGKMIIQGYNDLATANPELVKDWDYEKNYPITPQDVSKSSGKVFWWHCSKCGYEYRMSVNDRNNRHGCSKCANRIRGEKQKRKIINLDTNEVFDSIIEASKSVNLSPSAIGKCVSGKQKTSGGYRWKYVN